MQQPKQLPPQVITSINSLKFKDEIPGEVLPQDLPLGQAMLRAGFKRITSEEMDKKLQISRHNLQELAEAYNRANKYKDELLNKSSWWRKIFNPPYVKEEGAGEIKAGHKIFTYKRYEKVAIPLENYSEEAIPVDCLEKINKAKTLGIKHLYVAQISDRSNPIAGLDPIVIASIFKPATYIPNVISFNRTAWFEIASWE